ncbi:MAG: hypothetical protein ABIJ09_17015 [Pseudomonadota bacterium]
MLRITLITTALYTVLVLALGVPLGYLAFVGDKTAFTDEPLGYLAWIGGLGLVLGLSQAVLLATRVERSWARPTPQRPLWKPVLAASLLMGFMLFCALIMAGIVLIGDDSLGVFDAPWVWLTLALLLLLWGAWALVFRRLGQQHGVDGLLDRASRWVLAGSLLELLIAVPAHVLARRRDDCCAPTVSYLGLVTGLAVLLMSFGPGVYFLFAQRLANKRKAQKGSATSR